MQNPTDVTLNILIIDDETFILNALKREFSILDFQISWASCSTKAMELLKTEKFACVISDFLMPEFSGIDIMKQVAATSPLTRRILITGHPDHPEIKEANKMNLFHGFLPKPWDKYELLTLIRDQISEFRDTI
ncbi:MAG: response regulator [SAR324 cluster bacterium]|nr:response regulator [SAR324 cluster bacterium]